MAFELPQAPHWPSLIKSGCRVFVGGNASVPYALIQHLIDNSEGFSDIELVHMLALGDTRWVQDKYKNL
ncbi:MAG: 4-hydroxybutyrate CoA-transferase, partial [Pseudomonadota bacterium]|nr:4-hydroxybutyrate CoA-transferase [Pseudomonadota bacterium]